MKVVIQCAGSKVPSAGFFQTKAGKRVKFVAHPEKTPASSDWEWAHPDDDAPSDRPGTSWREQLDNYDDTRHDNPFKLLEAYRLYRPPIYRELVSKFGLENVLILSAGWGLVRANYPLPIYDITFSGNADAYKRRGKGDPYEDFCHLSPDDEGPIYFFGGKDYLPLFYRLAKQLPAEKIVFYASSEAPVQTGWRTVRYKPVHTNWHYACARAFLNDELSI